MVEFKRRQRKKKVETRNYCKNREPCDVFINHRGSDTKKNIAGLLYDHLSRLGIKPFMDSRNMKPGDKLSDEIDAAIRNCKVAVALLSRNYCESRHCLRELALLMESNKKVLPIFWDVSPSELWVNNNGCQFSDEELRRFERALEQVKDTVGLTFDSSKGDWSEFLEVASKEVKNLLEVDQD
ncbi:probable 2' cyclic ADP-D-ribose synthase BdTIR [Corylus avellana]|uniref:probable 2' cyclic ADP-D-ribose synthase BdTIR n=1 Tax=Corylus avellana TaxID=13451 RepID=UPI00286C98CA|nr:probable 2' cyclic ADP-D-ribose synthase BdTIR [Corylus avellana]